MTIFFLVSQKILRQRYRNVNDDDGDDVQCFAKSVLQKMYATPLWLTIFW